MKKIVAALLIGICLVSLSGCGGGADLPSLRNMEGRVSPAPVPTETPSPTPCGKYGAYSRDFDGAFEKFLAEHGYDEYNFAMAYYNTVTGETILYNADKGIVGASLYKLPLNMYLTDCYGDGTCSPDDKLMGFTLREIMEKSLVYSNNEVSERLCYYLGGNNTRNGKTLFGQYLDDPEMAESQDFLIDCKYTATDMLHVLKHLYNNSDKYDEVLGFMKEANPGYWFRAAITDVPVAQKYGATEYVANTAGIIYVEQPFMLVVMSQYMGSEAPEKTAEFMYAYYLDNE